jgi:hypothetical protein
MKIKKGKFFHWRASTMAKITHKMAEKGKTATPKTKAKAKPQKKYLDRVPEVNVFWCHDGQVFRDINDLLNGFDLMSDETYLYHANQAKNDFSCWIVDVIGDKALGKDIKKAKTRHEAKNFAVKRYSDLTRLEG